ncbi:Elongation factor Tu [Actinomadura sp. RB99]|uniref:selenocysteine-specific translation elongation factor n=1 Tax=Actinomadura sp. RB99 TaxID=2691577 RepID=UPI00199FB16B|nr:SelB C-terminal domain-containing protein [Actinomadura sp. RB99]MBD2893929.1 Elongation factor Tu [Actinomadura sp. RB99]
MQVVATAGHHGHGKSALVRALTGMEPEEPGAWTELPSGARLAFVDVPGDERSVPAMLAGVGAVPAVLFAVAADEGWMPQSQEHLDALAALGVQAGVLAVTRADVADPKLALRQARDRLAGTALRGVEAVAVSTVTGAGMDELAAALDRLAGRLPVPDPEAPVRLWLEHAFTAGRQSVVAGTLAAGTIAVGDELLLMPAGRRVRVRTIGSTGAPRESATGVSRVVLTLRDAGRVGAGMALVTPDRWSLTTCVDVRTRFGEASGRLARRMTLHIGAAAVPVRLRPLGPDTARLTLNARLALHIGDTALLRDPERRAVAGVSVLDVRPPTLVRRDAGAARARELAGWPDRPDGALVLRRHGVLRASELELMGCAPPDGAVALDGGWLADPAHWEALRERLAEVAARHAAETPHAPGLPLETARLRLGLPARSLVAALVRPPLRLDGGRVHPPAPEPAPQAPPNAAPPRPAVPPDADTPPVAPVPPSTDPAPPAAAPAPAATPPSAATPTSAVRPSNAAPAASPAPAPSASPPSSAAPASGAAPASSAVPSPDAGPPSSAAPSQSAAESPATVADPGREAGSAQSTGADGAAARPSGEAAMPPGLAAAVERLRADLARAPFDAPAEERLAELGLTGGALAAAERAGAVLRLRDGIVLLPGADREALRILSALPQPFTPRQAGDALSTSRRVAVALLEHLDGLGLTERRR